MSGFIAFIVLVVGGIFFWKKFTQDVPNIKEENKKILQIIKTFYFDLRDQIIKILNLREEIKWQKKNQ